MFQSTPLREGRPKQQVSAINTYKFQSTPLREGRQNIGFPKAKPLIVSIHAPARGATQQAADI